MSAIKYIVLLLWSVGLAYGGYAYKSYEEAQAANSTLAVARKEATAEADRIIAEAKEIAAKTASRQTNAAVVRQAVAADVSLENCTVSPATASVLLDAATKALGED